MKRRKRFIAWILALFMVFALQPLAGEGVHAAETMDAWISQDGVLGWENVMLADTYKWDVDSVHTYIVQNEWEADLNAALNELATNGYKPEGGEYVITVKAYHDDVLQASVTLPPYTYYPNGATEMQDVAWDGPILSWGPVDGASYYMVLVEGNGNSQEERSADLSRIIDTLIKKGNLDNSQTMWNVRIEARSEEDELLAYWKDTFEYVSSAAYVEPAALTIDVRGTEIAVTPLVGVTTYQLSYESYMQNYEAAQFDCYDYLEWLHDCSVIADGETVDIEVLALDRDEVTLGTGTARVTFERQQAAGGITDIVDIGNIWSPLYAGPGLFTTEINPDRTINGTPLDSMLYIEREWWVDKETGAVVDRENGEFLTGHTYEYYVTIGTFAGASIAGDFEFIVGGSPVTDYGIEDASTCPEGYSRLTLTGFLQGTVLYDAPIQALAKLSADTFVYNGKVQKPTVTVTAQEDGRTITLQEGEDYELHFVGGDLKSVGGYGVSVWGINPKYDVGILLPYEITKAAQSITGPKASYAKTGASAAFSLNAKAKESAKLTYKSSNTSVVTVSSAGKVTIKGAGTAKITIKAAATANYKAGTKTITIKVTKATNPMTASGKTAVVKASKVRTANQTIAKTSAFKIAGAQGTVTFKKATGNAKIVVGKTGKITVKKGLKKGTYKVKVKVTAAGTAKYKAVTKTVTVTVTVK